MPCGCVLALTFLALVGLGLAGMNPSGFVVVAAIWAGGAMFAASLVIGVIRDSGSRLTVSARPGDLWIGILAAAGLLLLGGGLMARFVLPGSILPPDAFQSGH